MYQHYKDVINIMGFSLINVYIFIKSINYTLSSIKKVIMLVLCILCAVIYVSIRLFMPSLMATVIQCIIFIIFIWKLMEIKLDTVISAYLLSYGISYSLLSIVTIIIGFVSIPFINVRYTNDVFYDFNEPIFLLFATLIAIFQFILAFLLFKIKRFRKGFPFLFKKYAVILALIVAGIVLTMISLLTAPRESYEDDYSIPMLFAGIITVGTGIIIWIRRGIKMFYKQNMKERSIELLEQEVSQKERENKLLSEQNDALRIESHKINHRLAALERSVTALAKKIQNNAYSTEFSEELTITIDDIKRLSREYQDGIARIKRKKPLPSTKIKILDDLFEYFSTQYMDNDIEFNLKINGSIPYMVEHIIPQNKLETMIGDHLQDALIAVKKIPILSVMF